MKNKNRIILSIFVLLCCLNTAQAWKVEKDGTAQMQLTDDGSIYAVKNIYADENIYSANDIHADNDMYADNFNKNSDKRLKKDILTLKNSLEKVSKLRGVTYRWKDINKSQHIQMGFIAQEVEKIVPEVVSKPNDNNNRKFYSMDYSKLTALLVEAVKELKNQNDKLKILVCQDHPDADICIDKQ